MPFAPTNKLLNQKEIVPFRCPKDNFLPGKTFNAYICLNKSKRVSKVETDWVVVLSTFSKLKSLLPSPTIFSGLILKDIVEPAATVG